MKSDYRDLEKLITDHKLQTVSVVTPDLHGIAKGKKVSAAKFLQNKTSPIRLSTMMAMLDIGGLPYQPPDGDSRWWPSWSEGYGDTRACIDPKTARLVPWQPGTALVLCDMESVNGKGVLDYLPRVMLRRLTERLEKLGYTSKAAMEMEFVLFAETDATAALKGYKNLTPLWAIPQAYSLTVMGRHNATISRIRDQLTAFGLPAESWSVEAAPGQLEINLPPMDALAAADQGFLFKHGIKELAAEMGIYASFAPKFCAQGFGSGAHLNLSLVRDGRNAFGGARSNGQPDVLKYFIGGLVSTLREFTLMYAPTVNAYRRFVPHTSTGMMVSWGYDNKTNAIRTITESPELCRIEQRTAGGDVNPYLLVAACLAAGIYGIENKIAPPPPVMTDAYLAPGLQTVPLQLEEAIRLFESSAVTKTYLGENFVRFYAHCCRQEAQAFRMATAHLRDTAEVTDWELARYVEVI